MENLSIQMKYLFSLIIIFHSKVIMTNNQLFIYCLFLKYFLSPVFMQFCIYSSVNEIFKLFSDHMTWHRGRWQREFKRIGKCENTLVANKSVSWSFQWHGFWTHSGNNDVLQSGLAKTCASGTQNTQSFQQW